MINILGFSDDTIEIDGDTRLLKEDSISVYGIEKGLIKVSDGTVLEVEYNGCWRFVLRKRGALFDHIRVCDYNEDETDGYTDIAYFNDGVTSVQFTDWMEAGKLTIQLVGSITNNPDAEQEFACAAERLRNAGHNIINPFELCADICRDQAFHWWECLSLCLESLIGGGIDFTVSVNNPERSIGTQIELLVAEKFGIPHCNGWLSFPSRCITERHLLGAMSDIRIALGLPGERTEV